MFFYALILTLGLLDVAWWRIVDRKLRHIGLAAGWRIGWGLFMAMQLAGYLTMMISRATHHTPPMPGILIATLYIWHLFIQPLAIGIWLFWQTGSSAGRAIVRRVRPAPAAHAPSRRQVLVAGAMGFPPILNTFATAGAIRQQEHFQTIRLDVPIPGLPPQLNGLRIAHVSDTHVGKFTQGDKLDQIADAVTRLDVDLVAFTGDLIDYSLRDLDASVAMVRRFGSRYGTFLCEGNHDLFEGRKEFESSLRDNGLRLLINEAATLNIRGQKVQMLGLRWGYAPDFRNAFYEENLLYLRPRIDRTAFPILLAHHPHAFDPAAVAGVPLTLSGHTHGGQIMLTKHIGPGPLMYKYWSGVYRKPNASLVVSNGVGNWFPLRINAPAQIAELTLRRA